MLSFIASVQELGGGMFMTGEEGSEGGEGGGGEAYDDDDDGDDDGDGGDDDEDYRSCEGEEAVKPEGSPIAAAAAAPPAFRQRAGSIFGNSSTAPAGE